MKVLARLCVSILVLALFIPFAQVTQATYSLSITGVADFQADAWTPEIFEGFVVIGLGNSSQGPLNIEMTSTGTVSQWVNWTDETNFLIYPAEQKTIHFTVDFPSVAPDSYDGLIIASGIPDHSEQSGGASVPGNIGVAIGISIDIQARLFFEAVYADNSGARSITTNNLNETFNGTVTYNLSDESGWVETHNQSISNLMSNSSFFSNVSWNNQILLGETYTCDFFLQDNNGTLIDEKHQSFKLPTPADITGVWHSPNIVYADYDATIHATVHEHQNGTTQCTAHYIIDGGAEQTGPMDYGGGQYLFNIDNASYQAGSNVEYWVTSFNDASGVNYSDVSSHKTFRVYPSTAPDLVIDGIIFSPRDPQTETMYDSNITNIFVTIRNAGRGDVSDLVVEMFDYNNSIVRETVVSLTAGNSTVVRFAWETPTAGPHLLRFVADPDDDFAETNENNNYLSVEVSVSETPEPTNTPPASPWDPVPYILIPIILFIILLLFLRRKRTINVTISEVKPFRHPKEGTMRWKYTCSYGDNIILGKTRSTDIQADVGTVIQVRPIGLHAREDGTIAWKDAEVKAVAEEPDSENAIRKLIKKERK